MKSLSLYPMTHERLRDYMERYGDEVEVFTGVNDHNEKTRITITPLGILEKSCNRIRTFFVSRNKELIMTEVGKYTPIKIITNLTTGITLHV